MIIAVASGKGGTGKTTVSVALALSSTRPVQLLDCDVEEPNCDIFLNSEMTRTETVTVPVPVVEQSKCTGCGECSRICQFNAIVVLGKKVLIFNEMCHSCGGCMRVCPEGAISEVDNRIGVLEIGESRGVDFVYGRLDVGQAMSPPLIKAVKKRADADNEKMVIIDSPPGTSCPVIASVRDSDFIILVTEPTPFGLHDLKLAVETVRELGIPFGVVINRAGIGDDRVLQYCRDEKILILTAIQDDRRIAEAYSRGETLIDSIPELKDEFADLLNGIISGMIR
ncbi:MAG TPA: (4Fe-4S)-binding protein [Firmicutes bacterium]|nr:(4Fe-4S)-binding protein [Bacillota bacterium]